MIKEVDVKVHPLVLELTGKKTPKEGLEGKFSVYHAVAIAFIDGAGGEKQFSDRAVQDAKTIELRGKVVPTVDPSIKPEQVEMSVTLTDGRVLKKRIEHSIGSVEKPMSDADLERKFKDLAEGILPPEQTAKVMELCWKVEGLASAGDIARAGARSG
jgi:2-methylcitrate dehydratase PrpD